MKKTLFVSLFAIFIFSGCRFTKDEGPSINLIPTPAAEGVTESDYKKVLDDAGIAYTVPNDNNLEITFENGKQELEKVPSIKLDAPVNFDGCGKPDIYKNESWFNDFSKSVSDYDAINSDDATALYEINKNNGPEFTSPEYFIKRFGKISAESLGEICYSKDGNLIIALFPGDYCIKGSIFRYDIDNNIIEKANFLEKVESCLATFFEFGKRNNNIVPVTAGFGDAGCSSKTYYDYNFVENTLKATRSCGQCMEDLGTDNEHMGEEKCANL